MNICKEQQDLLKQITALDFVQVDLQLYLNTHPCDGEALAKYNSIAAQACEARAVYERAYGPLSLGCPTNSCEWDWIDEPWPWEYEANFKLCAEER